MANLLHLTHRYWPVQGGSEQYVRQIAQRQAAEGHQVTVVASNADDLAYFWQREARALPAGPDQDGAVRVERVAVGHWPAGRWLFGGLRRLQVALPPLAGRLGRYAPYLPDLDRVLGDLERDWQAVFAWNITFDGLTTAAWEMARRCEARFIAVPLLHLGEGPGSPVRRFYTMPHQVALLRRADRVLALTAVEQTYLASQGIAPERLAVVGAGIDPAELAGGDGERFRQAHGLKDPIVAAIGPLTRDKGTLDLLAAAEWLWENGRSFDLLLVGPMMPDFAARLEQTPLPFRGRCHCLGRVSDATKRDLLAAMSLLALPSRTDSFGIVLLEAWFYGKPVVAAQAGGLAAVVDDGVNGRLVPFGDVAALAGAIVEILDDPEKGARWGGAGQAKTNTHDWATVYRRWTLENL